MFINKLNMGANRRKVLEVVSGWLALELILQCMLFGVWQLLKIAVKRLWKGHRRKTKNYPPVELTVDPAIGTHCYIKVLGVKYHYVESGPKTGQTVLILGDAPDSNKLWCSDWAKVVLQMSNSGHHVITLNLRGTGGSEGGSRSELSPPKVVEELSTLLNALGVSQSNPAIIVGFGIGGMLTWYLVHCYADLISKFVVIGAPHPNLYWQYPPAPFCEKALHFIQWPHFPESWLADGEVQESEKKWSNSRASDWSSALNYVRGAAWWRIRAGLKAQPPGLLIGSQASAAQLVTSAQFCGSYKLQLLDQLSGRGADIALAMLDFIVEPEKPRGPAPMGARLMSRVLGSVGSVVERGRELTGRYTPDALRKP